MKKLLSNKKFGQQIISFLLLLVMMGSEIVSLPLAKAAVLSAAGEVAANDGRTNKDAKNADSRDRAVTNADGVNATTDAQHGVSSITLKDLIPSFGVAHADGGKVDKADKPNSPSTIYDLVALVVDTDLDQDKNSYNGLKKYEQYQEFFGKIPDKELGQRVLRYAEDIQKNNDLTDVKIIFFDKKKDSVQDLAAALENLYRNGDGSYNNRLAGLVLIGDVPLPVVNKNGNRYVSMFPYTDFSDKAYVFNKKSKSFEKNPAVTFPKVEIWHGVIRAPGTEFADREKLAEFFDKNHLYYEGVPMFSKFERRMFFGDLVHEEEGENAESYKYYVKYLAALEDLVYMRYNKFWAAALTKKNMDLLQNIPEDIKPKGANAKFLDSIKGTNPASSIPDIYSKNIIDGLLAPYYKTLEKYIGRVNDWTAYTARYDKGDKPLMNVDSVPGLIATKDMYTQYYLKSVNDALEKQINELANLIQEPISLVDYSKLSGAISEQIVNKPFEVAASDPALKNGTFTTNNIFYRFNYKNEVDGKWYINGSDATILTSPKQCMPLLGSTKQEYFDKDLNYNPMDVKGKYSILTRALRSTNFMTNQPLHTTGVNTRLLSPLSLGGQTSELYQATGGAYLGEAHADGTYDTGAVVEDNPTYGISAFMHNPYAAKDSKYLGPLEKVMKKGDVIVKVNGKNINSSYTFDSAIEESYQMAKVVINIINDKNGPKASEKLKNFPYPIKVVPTQNLDMVSAVKIGAYFSVSFYHGKDLKTEYFSFTVDKDGLTSNADPQGKPEAYLLLDTPPKIDFNDMAVFNSFVGDADHPSNTQGAIFTLYKNKNQGYNDAVYDASAGCNASSAAVNSDRCLGIVASMPVLDPAGSMGPVIEDGKLQFPESYNVDLQNHVQSYQFPSGKKSSDQNYQYGDLDEVYMNSCYSGWPSLSSSDENSDSNPFKFVLDSTSNAGNADHEVSPGDFYGKLMRKMAEFVGDPKAKMADYESENGSFDASGKPKKSSYNPKEKIWADADKLDASQVVLNNTDPVNGLPEITLKDFSDHYGLFDGIDNDGDGLTDYEWRDGDPKANPPIDADGVADWKYYDFKEADTKYGIPSWDKQQIARKLLSHDGAYTIPYGNPAFPDKKFNKNITLVVKADTVKTISSVIIHNEPTNYTVSQQDKAKTTFSMPIDNPRYVAFQTEPKKGPAYPDPKPLKPDLNVQEILDFLGSTIYPPIYPGEIHKIKYVNLFDPEIRNIPQLQSALFDKATEIASLPGAYRILKNPPKDGKYEIKDVRDEILNNYFLPVIPVVKNAQGDAAEDSPDDPADGFSIKKASVKKIHDSFRWLTLNIDEKHQYVLQNYLSGDEKNQGNAYAADHTLLPSGAAKSGFGYEAAYLVLNGDNDHFEMRFNKDLPDEGDESFDPLKQVVNSASAENDKGNNNGGQGAGAEGGAKEDDEYQFVWLQDWLKELKKFTDSLTTVPKFTNECFNIASWEFGDKEKKEKAKDAKPDEVGNIPDPNANVVQLDSYIYKEISGYDELVIAIEEQKKNVKNDKSDQKNEGETAGENGAQNSTGENSGDNGNNGTTKDVAKDSGTNVSNSSNGQDGAAQKPDSESLNKALKKVNNNTKKDSNTAKDKSGNGSGTSGKNDTTKGNANQKNGGIASGNENATQPESGDGSGQNGGGNAADSANSADVAGDQSNLKILKSTLVEDKTKGVERTPGKESPSKIEETKLPEKTDNLEETKPVESPKKWEDYFIGEKYYQKYLLPRPQTNKGRLLAELFTDNPFTEAEKDDYSKYQVESGDSMTADNVSLMKIVAVIYDDKGKVETDKTHKVKFTLSSNLATFSGDNMVESKEGLASVYIKAGKVAGDFTIKEEVMKGKNVDTSYQVVTKDLHLLAGEAAGIEIESDSNLLVANGQSKIPLNFILKDKFGNVANNSFNKIAVFVNDIAKFVKNSDSDSQLIGTQLDTLDGKASASLFAGYKPGTADVVALMMEPELEDVLLEAGDDISKIDFSKYVGATKSFKVYDKIDLSLDTYDENFQPTNSIVANGKSVVHIGAKLVQNGQILSNYNGPIKFKVLKPNLGSFIAKPPANLVNGEMNSANISFMAGKLAGDEEILVEVPGFASDTLKFKVKADKADHIELISSNESIESDSKKLVTISARFLDANNNLLSDDNGTIVIFGATTATKDLINFSEEMSLTQNGVAIAHVSGKNLSGNANIIAESKGLKKGSISLKINKRVTNEIAKNFSPRALYVSLLGGAFGRIDEPENLANTLLYSQGQVEALSAVTAVKEDHKRLFGVDAYGKINFMTETVYGKVVPATNSFPYTKVVLSDDIAGDELANIFLVPIVNSPVLLLDEKTDIPVKDGIFIKVLDAGNVPLFSQEEEGVVLKNGSDTKVKVDKFGRIYLNDDSYQLSVPKSDDGFDTSNFSFLLSKGGNNLALISYNQNFGQNVKVLSFGSQQKSFQPGVYLQAATDKNKYQFSPSYSGASTAEAQGWYLVNMEENIDSSQAPGFGYGSLESAKNDEGVGFEGSNKHMLLFAAGNSVGNSYLPYASDSGIIYGDPTIKLKVDGDLVSKDTGYSKDIGKMIYSGTEPIQQTLNFDANGDGYDDLLLVYGNGLIRLLENEISNGKFRDRGYVLNMVKGIYGIAKIDANNDGYDDLVIGTKESCVAGEQCISMIMNDHGSFNRSPLNLALQNRKVYQMKAADMNNDGCDDLVTADSSGSISVFYNKSDGKSCQGLETNYGYSKNFGFVLNSDLNQVDNLFINYPEMEPPDGGMDKVDPATGGEASKSNWYKFVQFNLPTSEPPPNNPNEKDPNFNSAGYAQDATDLQNLVVNSTNIGTKDVPAQTYNKQYDFIHIKEDSNFALKSSKQGKDLNGGPVELGDIVEYMIVLKNDGNNGVSNLMLSDATPTSMTLKKESLKCLDAGCPDNLEWIDTGMSLRSGIIKNISVPAHGQRIISYQMSVDVVPKINFDISNDFVKYPSNNGDPYLDIMIRPEVNPDGIITYLYSTGPKSFEKFEANPADDSKNAVDDTFKKQGLPTPSDLLKTSSDAKGNNNYSMPPEMAAALTKFGANQSLDKDYNGCSDNWNKLLATSQDQGEAIANEVGSVLNSLRCSGAGCAPIPYNMAFLTPNTPVAGVPGIPVVNIWNVFPYFVPFSPATLPQSVFRMYLSPTLTLGLGTAICASPGGGGSTTGMCMAFAVPGGIPGVCSAVKASINKAVSSAKSAVIDPAAGQSAVITDGQDVGGTKAVEKGGSWGGANDPLSAISKTNIKIPGFPSVLTNWVDGEVDEIYSKLLRFPTFYFIFPDFGRVLQEGKLATQNFSFNGFHDFATSLSNFPFVKIEGKEIVMKVPAISPKEIAKYKQQWVAWKKHMEHEMQKYKMWDCASNENRKALCDKIGVDMVTLTNSVTKLMDTLDQISNLPKDILTWRTVQAKYATQIICYLDAIMNYTGGYIKRQQKIIESWIKAIQDTMRTFKQWKLIMDTMAEYQESCDKCKNDRFSKLGLLMQLFAVVPDLPIIPLPKWPDVVVDFSQIKTGVTIVWPDVIFRPEPIVLPNLPDINLPDVLPPDLKIDLSLPQFDFKLNLNLASLQKFTMPKLPDLPQVPLPQLPDLPKPPKIPALPNFVGKFMTNLKFIFKILCLLKNGYMPIPENTLGTQIETLTQPSVQAVLPIIKGFGMQWPAIQYSYVDQIRITGKLNFTIDTSFVYVLADIGAQKWNENIVKFVGGFNKITSFPYGQALNKYIQENIDKAYGLEKEKQNELQNKVDEKTSALPLNLDLSGIKDYQNEVDDYIAKMEKEDKIPDTYHLIASQNFLNSADPILNRSLAELENTIKFEDLPEGGNMRQLAAIRDQMIAYTKDLNSTNSVLGEIEDYNDFTKVLADNASSRVDLIAANPSLSDIGTSNISDKVSGKTLQFSFLGKEVESVLNEAAVSANLKGKRDLIATAMNISPQEMANKANGPAPTAAGMQVKVGDVDEVVLNYTAELKGNTSLLFSDVDHDKDSDIIYSTGGDVYLKNNYKNSPKLPKGHLINGYTNNSVGDYVNDGGLAVDGIKAPFVSTGKVDISWDAFADAVSYEVILRKSIYDDISKAAYTFEIPVSELNDKDAPRISKKIPNGNYYVSVFAINAEGKKSLPSETAIAAPQACADNDPPMPVINSTEYTLSVFKNLDINASASFDPDGEIVQYYVESLPFESSQTDPITNEKLKTSFFPKTLWSDANLLYDEDGNGIPFDDSSNPKFNLGPFVNEGDIGDHKFLLHVVDASGKDSNTQITVHVIAPDINLDPSFASSAVANGTTEPKIPQLPFWLMRNRYIYRVLQGKLKLVPKIEKLRESSTADDGNYSIQDFDLEDMILVQNADGKVIAEINPKTGDIGKVESGYKTLVNPAIPPKTPTSVSILDKNNQVLGTIYLVADANTDVNVLQNYGFTSETVKNLSGVNVDDLDDKDNYIFENLPVNDPDNPGGAILRNTVENKVLVSIDSTGNIVILDKRVSLAQKINDHKKDPLIIQINVEGKTVGEVYVSIYKPSVIVGPDDVPYMTPGKPSEGVINGSSSKVGVSDFANLVIDPSFKFSQEDLVKRKDFVKVLLKMICVIPRPEAYKPYDAGSGYADAAAFGDYHPDIKEATLLDFISGYKGETDAQGLSPFKPENNITRAETVKIILKALQYRGVIDMSSVKEGDPWYANYMEMAQNLTPHLKGTKPLKNNFIVSAEEAKDPYKLMNFGELLTMVQRVLDTYNCFEADTNANGLSDFCEAKYKISDPKADPDQDGLSNALECADNLNPLDADTDKGGVLDGKELAMHTNPLDKADDAVDDDRDGLSNSEEVNVYHTDPHNPDTDGGGKSDGKEVEECGDPLNPADDKGSNACKNQSVPGLYIVPSECNTCPCISTFLHKADLIPGDIFFPVVATYYKQYYESKPEDKTYIFKKGNEVQIQSVNK